LDLVTDQEACVVRELERPPETEGDPDATEMIRVWIAHQDLHVSMLLGMWADALDSDIDEREAWGLLLADLSRHVANGLNQSYGWPEDETLSIISRAYLDHLGDEDASITGGYPDDAE
jgi:hypothetical protein